MISGSPSVSAHLCLYSYSHAVLQMEEDTSNLQTEATALISRWCLLDATGDLQTRKPATLQGTKPLSGFIYCPKIHLTNF